MVAPNAIRWSRRDGWGVFSYGHRLITQEGAHAHHGGPNDGPQLRA